MLYTKKKALEYIIDLNINYNDDYFNTIQQSNNYKIIIKNCPISKKIHFTYRNASKNNSYGINDVTYTFKHKKINKYLKTK